MSTSSYFNSGRGLAQGSVNCKPSAPSWKTDYKGSRVLLHVEGHMVFSHRGAWLNGTTFLETGAIQTDFKEA